MELEPGIDHPRLGIGKLEFHVQAEVVGIEQVGQDGQLAHIAVLHDSEVFLGLQDREAQGFHFLQGLVMVEVCRPDVVLELEQAFVFTGLVQTDVFPACLDPVTIGVKAGEFVGKAEADSVVVVVKVFQRRGKGTGQGAAGIGAQTGKIACLFYPVPDFGKFGLFPGQVEVGLVGHGHFHIVRVSEQRQALFQQGGVGRNQEVFG